MNLPSIEQIGCENDLFLLSQANDSRHAHTWSNPFTKRIRVKEERKPLQPRTAFSVFPHQLTSFNFNYMTTHDEVEP